MMGLIAVRERSLFTVHLTLILVFLFASIGNATEHLEGLVEIPALHARLNAGRPDWPMGPVTLFKGPSMDAEIAVVVRDRSHLDSRNHSYEEVSAIVYDRKSVSDGRSWYKVRYSHGDIAMFAWLSQSDAGRFRLYADITNKSGLPFFTENWDKRLYQTPEMSASFIHFDKHDDSALVVADVRYGEDYKDAWFLVVIVQGSICGGLGNAGGAVIASGWVPAYAKNGSETVWWGIC